MFEVKLKEDEKRRSLIHHLVRKHEGSKPTSSLQVISISLFLFCQVLERLIEVKEMHWGFGGNSLHLNYSI
jgi:hypothetical protein